MNSKAMIAIKLVVTLVSVPLVSYLLQMASDEQVPDLLYFFDGLENVSINSTLSVGNYTDHQNYGMTNVTTINVMDNTTEAMNNGTTAVNTTMNATTTITSSMNETANETVARNAVANAEVMQNATNATAMASSMNEAANAIAQSIMNETMKAANATNETANALASEAMKNVTSEAMMNVTIAEFPEMQGNSSTVPLAEMEWAANASNHTRSGNTTADFQRSMNETEISREAY